MATQGRALLLTPHRHTSKVDTEGFHREICVALEETLPKGDLGISSQVGVLCAVRDEL
jgi:hypothetical protein